MTSLYQPQPDLSVVQRWADESVMEFGLKAGFFCKTPHELVTCGMPYGLQQPQHPHNTTHPSNVGGAKIISHTYYKDKDGNIYLAEPENRNPDYINIGCHFCKGCGQMTPTPGSGCRFFGVNGRPDMCVCTDSEMVNVRSHQRRKPNTTNQKVEVLVATLTEDPLSNAQQRLEQQKILTDKASTAAKDAEDGRAKARMVLEEAQKTFSDSVKNEEEAKVTETETASVLVALQREVDELIYAARREEIARKKQIIKETYEAQLADIAADEAALGHM
jgi:hypothetical protein